MKILMVCLGNICRSPLAQGILEKMIYEKGLNWKVDSAGTSGWHEGELPDGRSIVKGKEYGIDLTTQRSRKFLKEDFDRFDLILAMDASNYQNILKLAKNQLDIEKVKMILNYGYPNENRQVPDPYYDNSFEECYKLIELSCEKLIEKHLQSSLA